MCLKWARMERVARAGTLAGVDVMEVLVEMAGWGTGVEFRQVVCLVRWWGKQ
jgi:hypothetical protein